MRKLLRSQRLQSKPWRKVCIVPGLLLLECKCGTFYCEINEKITLHCSHYLTISSLQNQWKQNSKNSKECLKELTGNDETVGLKNWIIQIRFKRNLICHLVLFFHFTESHKWRQNPPFPRIVAQNRLSVASTGEIRADLKLRECQSSLFLFFTSHSSLLKLELLLIETYHKVPCCVIYFPSFLTALSMLSGEPHQFMVPQMHQIMLLLSLSYCCSFLKNLCLLPTCQSTVYCCWQST